MKKLLLLAMFVFLFFGCTDTVDEIPIYEIPLSAYFNDSYANSSIIWNPINDDMYPEDFYISIDLESNLSLKIKKYIITNDSDNTYDRYYKITEIHCYNNIITCDPPLEYSERLFAIYKDMTDDLYIIGTSSSGDLSQNICARWYYITSEEYEYKENNPSLDGYEIRFYNENNNIVYTKINSKFLYVNQSYYILAEVYTDPDEFFSEAGVVNSNNNITFIPTSIYTISEWYLSDEFYYKEERTTLNADSIDEFIENLYKLDDYF